MDHRHFPGPLTREDRQPCTIPIGRGPEQIKMDQLQEHRPSKHDVRFQIRADLPIDIREGDGNSGQRLLGRLAHALPAHRQGRIDMPLKREGILGIGDIKNGPRGDIHHRRFDENAPAMKSIEPVDVGRGEPAFQFNLSSLYDIIVSVIYTEKESHDFPCYHR